MIRVLVADRSPHDREALARLLRSDTAIDVVGSAADGEQTVQLTSRLKPHVVAMGSLDGANAEAVDDLEATRRIMANTPTPIVVTLSPGQAQNERAAALLAAGAVAALSRGAPGEREFIETIKAMAQVKVVGQRLRRARSTQPEPRPHGVGIIAIGASTGGPHALSRVLKPLPRDLPVPLVIVQHLSAGFVRGFAHWLDEHCALDVKLVDRTVRLRPGVAYLAPDGAHLRVARTALSNTSSVRGDLPYSLVLADGPLHEGFRPSASVLFESVAEAFGPRTLAVILTGMGRDGFSGLQRVHGAGGCIIAQDRQTSVVFGMPSMAVEGGLADHVLPVDHIADRILELVSAKEQR